METTKNEFTDDEKHFFEELGKYLETKIYFYGSIQRDDYIQGKSDIDVDIFTDNESSLITKLQHFLHVKKHKFKKFIWKLNNTNNIIHGHKIMYKNPEHGFNTEISIYNDSVKESILKEHNSKIILPFYISWLLILLKTFHYQLYLIDKNNYRYMKTHLLNYWLGLPDTEFVVIDYKKS